MIRLCLLALSLAACAPRGEITLDPAAAGVGKVERVFVATTRAADPETGHPGAGRAAAPRFARYDISVPPDRGAGTIVWPRQGRADPARDFLTVAATPFEDAAAFRVALRRQLAALPPGKREAVLFVHGFNNTFAEGLYRAAQIAGDFDLAGPVLHYSWPSTANPLGYAYDRDSALFARDGLESFLREVEAAGAERVLLVAHSMGAQLLMETLRQVAIGRDAGLLRRISGVILVSPDIDIDVFHAEARRIGHLPQPFVIFTSSRDRALALSARLTGLRQRLGNLAEVQKVADLEVTVFDVSAFSKGVGHFTAATSPALIRILARMNDLDSAYAGDRTGRTGLIPGVVLTVQSATQIILQPAAALAAAAGVTPGP